MEFPHDPRFVALVERARARGWVAELFVQELLRTELVVHKGSLESHRRSESRGMGLRVERGGRVGTASTTELDEAGLEECLTQAMEVASVSDPQPVVSIPEDGGSEDSPVDLAAGDLLDLDHGTRLEAARDAEEAAFASDPRITKSESATWSDLLVSTRILNSHGMDHSQRWGQAGLSVDLVATASGEERTAYHHESRSSVAELDPCAVGEHAARKALALLGSRVHGTARVPVLLDHEVVAELLELLGESFSARACLNGSSMLAGRRGETIAAACVQLSDDPLDTRGTGRIAYDDEGMAARRTGLIRDGRLESFLHNTHTAHRMQEDSTGNALRGSFAGGVGVGAQQLVLRPGERDPESILSDLRRGVLVSSVMGLHMADTVSGDFSLGIVGQVIEDGELAGAIEGMTIAGNLLSLLQAVEEIAADYHPHGDLGCPSVLVGGLTVSGR